MKKVITIKKLFVIAILIFTTSIIWQSCENNQNEIEENSTDLTDKILDKDTTLDDLVLPAGTKISQVSDQRIDIELPSDFVFLIYDEMEGVSYSSFGSYSCTCSARGSCPVIYNEKVGYGCMQGNCKGSCTGKAGSGGGGSIDPKKLIYGVLNTKENSLMAENFLEEGNLTRLGYDIFFEKIANEELDEFFDFAFSSSEYDNSMEMIEAEGEDNITRVKLQYMGISFWAAVPNFDEHKNNQLINFKIAGPKVTCKGSEKCTCTLDKKCLFGNCVYYCDGCTTCTMSVK